MNKALESNSDYLRLPDWSTVRPIYKKLSDEFHVLTEAHHVPVEDRIKLMLDHLILGIDEVDQTIDELPLQSERDELTGSILAYLKQGGKNWTHHLASPFLIERILILKQIVDELEIQTRFLRAVTQIFDHTEKKRHVSTEKDLIKLVKMEGRATAELPLSILGVEASHSFAHFFGRLSMLMGIADLIVDARSDYRVGYIALRPTLRLYLRLNWILIKEGFLLLRNFPQKIKFIQYCARFSFSLLMSKG